MTATATPLPLRNLLINMSQSNGTTVADAKGFEDANPQIALRNPVSVALSSTFNQGSARDELVLPDPEFGTHQTINYRGKGSPTVRYLTFFNPTSTCLQRVGATVAMPTYPGEVEVGSIISGAEFQTKMIWQFDPSGKVTLTRKRTGKSYTIASASVIPGVQITVTESFDPPLEVGERFTHQIKAGQVSANSSVVSFYGQYGGQHDLGGVFEGTLDGTAADYPNAAVGSYTTSVWEVTFNAGSPGTVESVEHPLYLGRKVRFVERTGTLPVELATGTDYYIARIDPDDPTKAFLSATPEGPELTLSAAAGDFQISYQPDGRDSTMAGMNLRCVTGANVGEVRALGAVTNAAGVWTCNLTEAFTSPPALDDTFEIEPPDVGGVSVPFDKWGYFLPTCQFFGREQGLPAKNPVTITTGVTSSFLATDAAFPAVGAVDFYNGCPVRFYRKVYSDAAGTPSGEAWPTGLTEAATHYVVNFNAATKTFQVSATYDGVPIVLSGTSGEVHWICMAETWLQRDNPAPPGFNFNNIGCVPVPYQCYRGATFGITPDQAQPKIAYHWGWAQRVAERLGEDVYVVNLAVGGSTLSEVTVPPGGATAGTGWFDPASMIHWGPGDAALRARFLRTLDAAELAAEREGVQLRVRAVCFPQGESDGTTEDRANRYRGNLLTFKAFVRAELKRRGLWEGEADLLPFLQPEVFDGTAFTYDAVVNAAIVKVANADPFGRSWSAAGYTRMPDGIHYDGAGMNLLAQDAAQNTFPFLDGDDGNVLRVCRLALRMAGESASISSIYPPDEGSVEADMCAAFYPEAREHMLDRHAWDFLVRTELLVEAAANERTDWRHAYELPLNGRGVLGLGEDEMSAFDMRAVKIKHSIELSSKSERVLYANQPTPLYIRYKTRLVDPAKFDASFINACAMYMASMIVRSALKSEEGIKAGFALEKRAYGMFKEAASIDANQTRDTSQSQQIGWRR